MGMGLLIAASLVGIAWGHRRRFRKTLENWGAASPEASTSALAMTALIIVLMGIGLSFEIDRTIEQMAATGTSVLWPVAQLKHLSWTMLWMVALAAFLGLVVRIESDPFRPLALGAGHLGPAGITGGQNTSSSTRWPGA